MESKEEKTKRYYDYLAAKRDEFANNLARICVKLVCLNDGDYDLEDFLKTFTPQSRSVKHKNLVTRSLPM